MGRKRKSDVGARVWSATPARTWAEECRLAQVAFDAKRRQQDDLASAHGTRELQRLSTAELLATIPAPVPATHVCICGAPCWAPGPCDSCSEKEARARQALERMRIPEEFKWAHFDAPELAARVRDKKAIVTARAAAASADGVLLLGPAGSGKTSLAVCVLRARAERTAKPAALFFCTRLGVARAQAPLGSGEAPMVTEAMGLPLALLDDLGNERDGKDNVMVDIIFERHAARRWSVVTSGFSLADLVGRYGDGCVRRLRERAMLVELGGVK